MTEGKEGRELLGSKYLDRAPSGLRIDMLSKGSFDASTEIVEDGDVSSGRWLTMSAALQDRYI
jgi:hypothetical protein